MPLGWAAWSGLHCWALKCDDISESPSRRLNMQHPPSPYCGAKVGWDWWKLLHRWMYWGTSPHCTSNSQWALFVLLDYACKTHWNFHGGKPYPAWKYTLIWMYKNIFMQINNIHENCYGSWLFRTISCIDKNSRHSSPIYGGRPTILKMDMEQAGRQSKGCGIYVSAHLR